MPVLFLIEGDKVHHRRSLKVDSCHERPYHPMVYASMYNQTSSGLRLMSSPITTESITLNLRRCDMGV